MSKAVSFSRMMTYKKCPAQYEWGYVLGNRDDNGPGPAAQRGTIIHKSIEDFHTNEGDLHEEIPLIIASHINLYYDVPEWTAYPEYEFAVTAEWEPCAFDAEEAYIRGYIDNLFVKGEWDNPEAVEFDEYKTGGIYDEHDIQKALYAMIIFILFPNIAETVGYGVYIDKKKVFTTNYNRIHLHSMKFTWQRDIAKLDVAIYPARPGLHCRWCPKSSKKGGPCQLG